MISNGGREKPSVLIVGNFLSEAVGNRGVCEDLAQRLGQAGYRVTTASSRRSRLARLSDMLSTCWNQQKHYDIAQVDVYSGPAFFWSECVCWTLRRLQKPYILTLHGGKLPEFAAQHPRRVRRLLESAALVTAPSRYLQERLRESRRDIVLVPNALDLANYAYRPRLTARPKLTWLRAFHDIYNPAMAVEVVRILRQSYPSITLAMAGPDKGDGSLERTRELTARLNLEDALCFPGRIPKTQISDFINRGDIFLNTTNADNTPVSVLEAMACGACVVSTNVGGLGYILDHERNALLVEPNDAQAMAAAVSRLLESPELCRSLSEGARQSCETLDWEKILHKWEAAFQSLAPRLETGRLSFS